ncbi:MAG TPA: glycosyltransferase family 1 protein [Candidatus Moranbacteria bacterium]|nr:glycosyltransferase family 1 protein [Candidatus Moranbacteria bacterium]
MENKIGINVSFLRKPATGIGQVALNYLRTLNKNSQNIEYYLYAEEEFPEGLNLVKNFKKRVFFPPYTRDDLIRKIWWEKFLLPKKIKQDGCQSFISLYQSSTILPKNIRHTMVVHDIIPKLFPEYLNNWRKKLYWKLVERAIKKADKIIAISERTKQDLIKYLQIPQGKIEVRYLDVDEIYKKEVDEKKNQQVLEKYNLKPGYIYFGGGLEKRKNVEILLQAYKKLRNKIERLPKLVISGKLMPELAPLVTDVEKIIKELKLEKEVSLLDFVPQEDLPALYKNARIFVYPSLYEGFGLPVLEAMNCGVLVICSNSSSLPEVGGGAVEYFNPQNTGDLVAKIKAFLKDAESREKLVAKGEERVKKFSWRNFTK